MGGRDSVLGEFCADLLDLGDYTVQRNNHNGQRNEIAVFAISSFCFF